MKILRDELGFCETCMVITINGYDDNSTPEEHAASSAGIERLQANRGHLVPDYEYHGRGYDEFSARPCACCGSNLAGSRYDFAVLGPES